MVFADYIPHRIDLHLIEPAFAHVRGDLLGGGAVGVGEVGHRQLAALGVAGVAVLRQLFLPVPDQVAQRRLHAELVVETNLDDAVDVAQRLGAFELRVVVQPAGEGVDDLLARQPRAARTAHRQDEGEAELGVVVGVELLDAPEFLGRTVRQSRLALLVGGFAGERPRQHGLAGELRVGTDQRQLAVGRRIAHDVGHHLLQVAGRAEGPLRERLLGDPGRVFVEAVQQ
ncbi:MAG: hypothetical protein K0S48_3985, partial [Ramlibacter sp.]|nr:hypothetical protein [Ramlibacter sp.]